MSIDFTDENWGNEHHLQADALGYEDLESHYTGLLNDTVDTWSQVRPFGVYHLMNWLKNQCWNEQKQIKWQEEKRLKPARARGENLLRIHQGDEISSVECQRQAQYIMRLTEEIRVMKRIEEIAVRIHDECVEKFNNMPIGDDSERVFQFNPIGTPSKNSKVKTLDASTILLQDILDKTKNFDPKVETNLSELSKGILREE